MHPAARLLIIAGVVLIGVGLAWHFGARCPHLGRLPGDIVIERRHFRLYLPLATSLLLSLILSLVLLIVNHFRR